MITKSKIIANGVKINYIKTDKFKTNTISINFVAPLSKETAHCNSMIPPILMQGCEKYPTQAQLYKRLQLLYSGDIASNSTKYGEYHIFGIKANILNSRFASDLDITKEMIDLLCEMLFKPYVVGGAFDESYTEIEKINLIDAIEAEINDKGRYAIGRLMEEMCKDEIFSISKYGTVDDVKEITGKSLYNAYLKALREYPIEIYLVGDMDYNFAVHKFEEAFKSIERNPIALTAATTVYDVKEVKQVEDIENVKQGKLVLGFRTGYLPEESTYHLMQLFNEIYGGSPTAKLFTNVREKMSLCYYCKSSISRRTGIMIVSSGVEAKNKKIAEEAILEQLEMIKNGNISDEEFESAKKSLKNGYMQIYDSQGAMENWSFYPSFSGISTTPLREAEKIEKATKEEIQEIARKIKLDTVYFLRGMEGEECSG